MRDQLIDHTRGGQRAGTWTPAFFGSTTSGSPTHTTQTGAYIRDGKLCWISVTVTISSTGTMAGDVRISGLPFTAATSIACLACSEFLGFTLTAGHTVLGAEIRATENFIRLTENGSAASPAFIVATNIAASTNIIASGWYRVQ